MPETQLPLPFRADVVVGEGEVAILGYEGPAPWRVKCVATRDSHGRQLGLIAQLEGVSKVVLEGVT